MRHRSKFFIYYLLPLACSLLPVACPLSPVRAQEVASSSPEASPAADLLPLPQTGINLTVSPSVLDLKAEPDKATTTTIKVFNYRNEPEALQIKLLKFTPDSTGTKAVFQDLGPGDVFPQWLHFSEEQFVSPPNTWKEIQLTFTPPAYAGPAVYFAIGFQRQRDVQANLGTTTEGLPAILCLGEVTSSRMYQQVDLSSFKTSRRVYEFLPATFEIKLANSGNVHELVFGDVFIDWLTGHQTNIGTTQINAQRSYVMPQTNRTFETTWTDGFPHWDNGHLSWNPINFQQLRFGQFKAHMVLAYNDGTHDIPLEAETTFWVIPWRLMGGSLVIIGILLLGIKGVLSGLMKSVRRLH